jgi:hypothetical protein
LYSSPNIISGITSRRKRLAGHVVCREQKRILINPEGQTPLENVYVEGRIILKCILKV